MKWFSKADISYAAIMYYLVFNTLILVGLGYCAVGCVTYPYSNSFFNKTHKRQTNQRFGNEFIKCTERLCRVIQDMSETQGTMNTSAILTAPMDAATTAPTAENDLSSSQRTAIQLNSREIYTRVASNIELIGLYLQINEKIINEPGSQPSRLFRDLTQNLLQIKQTMDRIELKPSFAHPWFIQGKFVSFWAFYNKVNSLHEQASEMSN